MKNKENIIGIDFQGWPIYKMTLREILESLGAFSDNNTIGFKQDNPILDLFPRRLIDDGMGYGIDEQYIIESDTDNKTYINFFTEKEWSKEEKDKWLKENEELERLILNKKK